MRPLDALRISCLSALAVVAAVSSPRAISADIVISEFRVRGPNGGSDEFIELHNTSTASVDLSGWLIRGSNASGSVSTRVTISAGTVLGPGCFFLATNSSASGGPYSGPVPGNQTYGTGITDDGGIAVTTPGGAIVDQVGMSAGSAYKEGGPLASLGSVNVNRGYERLPGGAGGHADSDNNTADFQLLAPSNPQSLFSPCIVREAPAPPTGTGIAAPSTVDAGGTTLLRVQVTPGRMPVSTGLAVAADLTPLGGAAAQPFFDDGTHGDATAGDLTFSFFTAVGGTGGAHSITATVSDAEGRSTAATFTVTVTAAIAIHDIQGNGLQSPLVNTAVTTTGIVTAVRFSSFYIQAPADRWDSDPLTSEGLLVFTGSRPTVAPGELVKVSGTVQEFRPSGSTLTVTELASPIVTRLGGAPIPSAALLTSSDASPGGTSAQLERFEGMRVMADVKAISGTQSFFRDADDEANARADSNGDFWAVVASLPRPMREPGIERSVTLPAGAPCCVPRFDENPERFRVDSDGQVDATRLEIAAGQIIAGLTGVLDYAADAYTIVADPQPWEVAGNGSAVAVPVAAANELTIASFNMERLFDDRNDGKDDEPIVTAEAFARRLNKASLAVRHVMRLPDILGVEEVETLRVLEALATKINADAVAEGHPDPAYAAVLFEGNDIGGIDSGFLIKTARVDVREVYQVGLDATYTEPDGDIAILNDRPPVVLEAGIHGPSGGVLDVTVIVNHLRSLSGMAGNSADARRIRAKRRAQAEFLAAYVQGRQTANPGERIVSVGDYNAFEFSDGYVDVLGTIRGAPAPASEVVLSSADLVDPNLVSLGNELGPERYSFLFEGSAQTLDHIIVNEPMRRRFTRIAYARSNADFPESLRNDGTRAERLSDHDMPVAYFAFPGTPVITVAGENPMTVECGTPFEDPGATAVDAELGALPVETSGAADSGRCGSYALTYTASNGFVSASATRTVNVVDTTAPLLTLDGPATVTIEAGSTWLDPGAIAADVCAGDLSAAITRSGSVDTNTPGVYTLTYSVADGFNTTTVTRSVIVADTTPPSMTPLLVPPLLYPPNHKMVAVPVLYEASDLTGPAACSIAVTSDEPLNGPGDGNTAVDWQVLSSHLVRLRAERAGGPASAGRGADGRPAAAGSRLGTDEMSARARGGGGRVYTLTVTCTDAAGNAAARSAQVTVGK